MAVRVKQSESWLQQGFFGKIRTKFSDCRRVTVWRANFAAKHLIMTLHELFWKVDFDDIIPSLLSRDEKMAGSLTACKEAFDEVRLLTPTPVENDPVITLDYRMGDSKEACWVNWCDDDEWPVLAARTIDESGRRETSDAMIAALCLWEMTFYGYSAEDREEELHDGFLFYGFAEPRNKYEEEYRRLDKEWFPHRPVNSGYHPDKTLEKERWAQLKLLRRKAKIEDLCILMESTDCDGLTRDDLWDNLLDGFDLHRYRSVVEDPTKAVDYVVELLTKYDKADYSAYGQSFVIIHGNAEAMNGIERVASVINSHFPNPKIGIGHSDCNQIKITAVFTKK